MPKHGVFIVTVVLQLSRANSRAMPISRRYIRSTSHNRNNFRFLVIRPASPLRAYFVVDGPVQHQMQEVFRVFVARYEYRSHRAASF